MRIAIIIFLLVLLATSYAEDYVAVNSMDGRDVLSGIFYAHAKGLPVKFMPLPGGNAEMFASSIGTGHSVLLIQSDKPISSFVESSLLAGNNSVEVYTSTDAAAANLDLARRSGAESLIVVGSAYSDSALSVLPYAAMTRSYVILADKSNADQVRALAAGKKVMVYGLVDKEVSAALAPYSPETIGKGEDKFEDNIAISDRIMREFGIKSAIMLDGTFISDTMATGDRPLILTGRLVPQATYDFVKQKVAEGELAEIKIIRYDLFSAIYDMKGRMDHDLQAQGNNRTFSLIILFAQGIPSSNGMVMLPDSFPLPAYQPRLEVGEVAYNRDSGKVMASIANAGEGAAYYTLELRVRVDGADFKVFPAGTPQLVQAGESAGVEYPLDLSGVPEGNVTASVLVKYGMSKRSLDSFAARDGALATISYTDTSNVSVQFAKYDAANKRMLVTMRNNGPQTAYVFSRVSMLIGGQPTNITSAATRSLEPASLQVEEFPLELTDADLSANSNVSVFIDYGGRPGFLMKRALYVVPLESPANPLAALLAPAAILVALLAAAYYLFVRKPGEEQSGSKEAPAPRKAPPPRKKK